MSCAVSLALACLQPAPARAVCHENKFFRAALSVAVDLRGVRHGW